MVKNHQFSIETINFFIANKEKYKEMLSNNKSLGEIIFIAREDFYLNFGVIKEKCTWDKCPSPIAKEAFEYMTKIIAWLLEPEVELWK